MQERLTIMGNANDMPEWMRDRLAKQARRSITWTDRVRRVKEGESYLLLLCTANGAYEEHIVTARRAPDGEDLFELREDTGAVDRFVMYATGGGTLSPHPRVGRTAPCGVVHPAPLPPVDRPVAGRHHRHHRVHRHRL